MIPITFEFFPPKTDEQRDTLEAALPKLKSHSPDYVSVTFGAGGSTLSYTPETVRHLRENHWLETAPHVSCMGGTREEIRALLKQYHAMGCKRLVALRGDLPSGMATVRRDPLRHRSRRRSSATKPAIISTSKSRAIRKCIRSRTIRTRT